MGQEKNRLTFLLTGGISDFASSIYISKRKLMGAMLMTGKEKHEVFDWSDIVSMSQSEFV